MRARARLHQLEPHLWKLVAWGTLTGLVLAVAIPIIATAATPITITDTWTTNADDGLSDNSPYYYSNDPDTYNILDRWGNAIQTYHSKIGATDVMSIATNAIRGVNWSSTIGACVVLWDAAHQFYRFVFGFDLINLIGSGIDSMLAAVARLAYDPSTGQITTVVVLAFVVAAVIGIAASVRAGRGGGGAWWKRPLGTLTLMALLIAMAGGAIDSVAENENRADGADYVGVFPSPTWLMQTTEGAINVVATSVIAGFGSDTFTPAGSDTLTTSDQEGDFTCPAIIEALQDLRNIKVAESTYGSDFGDTSLAAAEQGYTISDTIAGLWADQALPMYKAAQYGTATTLGDRVYCHQLESNAKKSVSSQSSIMYYLNNDYVKPGQQADSSVSNKDSSSEKPDQEQAAENVLLPEGGSDQDISLVAWAFCTTSDGGTTWNINPSVDDFIAEGKRGEFAVDGGGATSNEGGCYNWWHKGATGSKQEHQLNIAPNVNDDDAINSGEQEVADFFNVLHGTNGGGFQSWPLVTSYAVGSVTSALVLFVLAIVVFMLKLLSFVFLIGFMMILIIGLFRRDGWLLLGKSFRQMLGAQIIVGFSLVLLSLLVALARLFSGVGAELFDPGSIPQILWTGLSPLMAVMLVNLVCVKVLKLPSPFSVKGGIAMAGAAGAVGGGVTAATMGRLGAGQGGSQTVAGMAKEAVGADLIGAARSRMPKSLQRRPQGMDGGLRKPGSNPGKTGLLPQTLGATGATGPDSLLSPPAEGVSAAASAQTQLAGAGRAGRRKIAEELGLRKKNRHDAIGGLSGAVGSKGRYTSIGNAAWSYGRSLFTTDPRKHALHRINARNALNSARGTKIAGLIDPSTGVSYVNRKGEIKQAKHRVAAAWVGGANSLARRRTMAVHEQAQRLGVDFNQASDAQRAQIMTAAKADLRRQDRQRAWQATKVVAGTAAVVAGGGVGAAVVGARLAKAGASKLRNAPSAHAAFQQQLQGATEARIVQLQRAQARQDRSDTHQAHGDTGTQANGHNAGQQGRRVPRTARKGREDS